MKKLAFTYDGTTLLHSANNDTVIAWSVEDRQLRYTCPGSLIGVSRDSKTFLTYLNETTFKAWVTDTGSEIALKDIDPENYELHQRTVVLGDRYKLVLRVQDVLNAHPTKLLRVLYRADLKSTGDTWAIDTWAMAPNNRYVIVTLSGGSAGHDWAIGRCIDIASGEKRYDFEVNRFITSPPINFSVEHNLLVMGSSGKGFHVCDLESGRTIRKVWLKGTGGNIISVNPQNKWLVATEVGQYIKERETRLFFIQLLDIEKLIQDGVIIQRGKIERVIEETGVVDSLIFHPAGKYLASWVVGQGSIRLWDATTSELVGTFVTSDPDMSEDARPIFRSFASRYEFQVPTEDLTKSTEMDISKGDRIKSSTNQHPTPRDVYLFILSKLQAAGGGFVTFTQENRERWVQVNQEYQEEILLNFSYPYDEEPNWLISQLGISFPSEFALLTWERQEFVVFEGPGYISTDLANTIDTLFLKLLGASPGYVVEGSIDNLG